MKRGRLRGLLVLVLISGLLGPPAAWAVMLVLKNGWGHYFGSIGDGLSLLVNDLAKGTGITDYASQSVQALSAGVGILLSCAVYYLSVSVKNENLTIKQSENMGSCLTRYTEILFKRYDAVNARDPAAYEKYGREMLALQWLQFSLFKHNLLKCETMKRWTISNCTGFPEDFMEYGEENGKQKISLAQIFQDMIQNRHFNSNDLFVEYMSIVLGSRISNISERCDKRVCDALSVLVEIKSPDESHECSCRNCRFRSILKYDENDSPGKSLTYQHNKTHDQSR